MNATSQTEVYKYFNFLERNSLFSFELLFTSYWKLYPHWTVSYSETQFLKKKYLMLRESGQRWWGTRSPAQVVRIHPHWHRWRLPVASGPEHGHVIAVSSSLQTQGLSRPAFSQEMSCSSRAHRHPSPASTVGFLERCCSQGLSVSRWSRKPFLCYCSFTVLGRGHFWILLPP